VLAIRSRAPFKASGPPPGIAPRSFRAGERVVFAPPQEWQK